MVHLGTNLFAKNHLIGVVSVSGCHQLSIEPNAFTIVMPSTGTILILLQHIFGLFWTPPTTYLISKRHQHTFILIFVPFLAAILHRGLRNFFFFYTSFTFSNFCLDFYFPLSIWTFFTFSIWTFISLFYLEFSFSI